MVVDVQAFLYCMNHFTISGSSCEPSKKGLSVSSVFIRAMSSADRVKSNMSRFCFMRSGFTDLGIIMHTDIYRAPDRCSVRKMTACSSNQMATCLCSIPTCCGIHLSGG